MEFSKILWSWSEENKTLFVSWNLHKFYSVDHWVKKYDNKGKKYYQSMHTKHIQFVKPDSETYLIQASIAGNLAFIELYIKS